MLMIITSLMGITMTQWDGSYYFDLARSGFDSMVSCFPNGKSEMGNQFVGEYVGRLLGFVWQYLGMLFGISVEVGDAITYNCSFRPLYNL